MLYLIVRVICIVYTNTPPDFNTIKIMQDLCTSKGLAGTGVHSLPGLALLLQSPSLAHLCIADTMLAYLG
jgi:hypothetical protein